ncbi:hypothetical protein [Szabonella alba]|uniref:Uncharacterized protein n=1 Tax=Szabonella alba TaxID=2804194 RepID=A0A8K0Y2S8_9RHOB|nr:hypothetical protein [Szabonella alba]MBL4919069.1 hypothetical protein [Szabonella alba]
MPAADGKTEFTAELDADPLDEMTKQAKEFIKESKVLSKKFGKITFSQKIMLDPRKWKKKTLNAGMYGAARWDLKILAVRVGQYAKDGKPDAKAEAALSKDYDKIVKAITKKLSLELEELEKGGDNKKALKDGKAAFAKLDNVDFKSAFTGPLKSAIDVMKWLEKAVSGRNAKNAFTKAAGDMATVSGQFDKVGREANAAVAFLMKSAKEHAKADDAGLQNFAKEIEKSEKIFQKFLSEAEAFEKTLDEAEATIKEGKLDAAGVKAEIVKLQRVAGVDKSAQEALKAAKTLKPAFLKIEKSLK